VSVAVLGNSYTNEIISSNVSVIDRLEPFELIMSKVCPYHNILQRSRDRYKWVYSECFEHSAPSGVWAFAFTAFEGLVIGSGERSSNTF